MNFRSFALAGVAIVMLATPAAAGTGYYIGLGAGFSGMDPVRFTNASPALSQTKAHDSSGVFAGAVGYKFDGIVRLESEIAYSSHDVKAASGSTGSTEVTTTLFNLVADIPVWENWNFSVGAGLGIGKVRHALSNGVFTYANGTKTGLAWQAIAGLTVPVSDQLDLFADYRYRNVELNQQFRTSFFGGGNLTGKGTHEQNLMFGLRWYFQ